MKVSVELDLPPEGVNGDQLVDFVDQVKRLAKFTDVSIEDVGAEIVVEGQEAADQDQHTLYASWTV